MITPFDTEETVAGHLEEDLASPILFFHGKESGPFGTKFKALDEAFDHVSSPDFTGLDLAARFAKAEEVTRDMTGLIVVGSSMGGILAAMLADRFPERFFGLVLVAPALHWAEAAEITRVPKMTEIVMGTEDEVVPLDEVRAWARKHFVPLTTTEDGHRMGRSLTEIVGLTRDLVSKRGEA